jgi:hypothetical protein
MYRIYKFIQRETELRGQSIRSTGFGVNWSIYHLCTQYECKLSIEIDQPFLPIFTFAFESSIGTIEYLWNINFVEKKPKIFSRYECQGNITLMLNKIHIIFIENSVFRDLLKRRVSIYGLLNYTDRH